MRKLISNTLFILSITTASVLASNSVEGDIDGGVLSTDNLSTVTITQNHEVSYFGMNSEQLRVYCDQRIQQEKEEKQKKLVQEQKDLIYTYLMTSGFLTADFNNNIDHALADNRISSTTKTVLTTMKKIINKLHNNPEIQSII